MLKLIAFLCAVCSWPTDTIAPISLFELTIPLPLIRDPEAFYMGIFGLDADDKYLYIHAWDTGISEISADPNPHIFQYSITNQNIFWYTFENKFVESDAGWQNYSSPSLIHNASSVFIDNRWIELHDAYSQDAVFKHPYNPDFLFRVNTFLNFAFHSFVGNYIGGVVTLHLYQGTPEQNFVGVLSECALWTQEGQKRDSIILYTDIEKDHIEKLPIYPFVAHGSFSRNGRFIYFKSLLESQGRQKYDAVIYPGTMLFHIESHILWPSNRDVAFTSDERCLVTERDGMPTLVDAETGANLQRYDIGEKNIMTAACFSPDDRQLYIAGIDRKIYVFNSHLPSRAAEWEVYP
ncbi:MAG TPA: hypothetical protein PK878_13785 [bacterium]|nr:hypothetical protein [bacterium]HPP01632.1 hypothetical protein [bacterium]